MLQHSELQTKSHLLIVVEEEEKEEEDHHLEDVVLSMKLGK